MFVRACRVSGLLKTLCFSLFQSGLVSQSHITFSLGQGRDLSATPQQFWSFLQTVASQDGVITILFQGIQVLFRLGSLKPSVCLFLESPAYLELKSLLLSVCKFSDVFPGAWVSQPCYRKLYFSPKRLKLGTRGEK